MMVAPSLSGLLLLFLSLSSASAQQCSYGEEGCCADAHERCPVWAQDGECRKNREYMMDHCPKSCKFCKDRSIKCQDTSEKCAEWAEMGECETNPWIMEEHCRATCKLCNTRYPRRVEGGDAFGKNDDEDDADEDSSACKDEHESCELWASAGECEKNPRYMKGYCKLSCNACPEETKEVRNLGQQDLTVEEAIKHSKKFGEEQAVDGAEKFDTLDRIIRTLDYIETRAFTELPEKLQKDCLNRNKLCSFWAAIGECEKNEAFMVTNCAPSCMSCHLIDFEARCPNLDLEPGLKPGDLNKVFQNIVDTAPGDHPELQSNDYNGPPYTVTVHSRPPQSEAISKDFDKGNPPWVITFDNFLSAEECQHLIDLGHEYGYERSKDVGAQKFDGSFDGRESTGRTSENAWCSGAKGCRDDPIVQMVHQRIGNITTLAPENSEDFQILKYTNGQFYRTHHDYIPHQKHRQSGPRILTFFLYLSDVEAGGGTNFPTLDITVKPKMGRALLWPSILNHDPREKDRRTDHQALPVEDGVKYAANAWIHLNDYITPQSKGCA